MTRKKLQAGVYIDGANIYHGGRDAGWQISYLKLKAFIERMHDISIMSYYSAYGYEKNSKGKYKKDSSGQFIPDPQTLKFLNGLRGNGIRVETKPLKFINGDTSKASNKMDGDLMLAAFEEHPQWDKLILLAGDSDYERLVKNMIKLSKPVLIMSYKDRMSLELKVLAVDSPYVNFTPIDAVRSILEYP
jgi:uncharacterized LabA/DUF88 family protein